MEAFDADNESRYSTATQLEKEEATQRLTSAYASLMASYLQNREGTSSSSSSSSLPPLHHRCICGQHRQSVK